MKMQIVGLDVLGYKEMSQLQKTTTVRSFIPGVLAGIAGWFLFRRKHPVLGAIGGFSAGSSGYMFVRQMPKTAGIGIVSTGVGIATSLFWKKHPALGFLGGSLGTGLVGSAIAGED